MLNYCSVTVTIINIHIIIHMPWNNPTPINKLVYEPLPLNLDSVNVLPISLNTSSSGKRKTSAGRTIISLSVFTRVMDLSLNVTTHSQTKLLLRLLVTSRGARLQRLHLAGPRLGTKPSLMCFRLRAGRTPSPSSHGIKVAEVLVT